MISNHIDLKEKDNFKVKKFMKRRFSELSEKEQSEQIKKDESWGRIVCRCEHITEAEVKNALSNPLGAKTLSSVKYRCRAGMGRCQGGFCTQHIIRLIQENIDSDIENIKLKTPNSKMFYGRTRKIKNE